MREPAEGIAAPNVPAPRTWGIVGGGLLGMTLAYRLAGAGHAVTIFEAASELGGLAAPWELGEIVWDRHYHVTLLSDANVRALLAELDLERDIRWVETKTGFFTDGRLLSMSNNIEFLRFPPLGMVAKARLAATILYASRVKNWKRLEAIPVADWLRRWSGRRAFERIWLPLLRSKLGDSYERTSAAFIWATIARMYAARRTGLKKEMFGYVPGGYARILSRFGEALAARGVQVRTSAPVTRVDRGAGGRVEVQADTDSRDTFDRVILTVPAPLAATICAGLTDDEKAKLRGVEYQGLVCASVLLTDSLSPYYVTNITDTWVPFTAVIEMSALVDRAEFGGNALVYLPKYAAPDDPIFAATDAEVERTFLDAVGRMHPSFSRAKVRQFRVSRVKQVFALSTLNFSDKLPSMATSLPGVHIANSAHIVNGTLNVNETVGLANRVASQLLDIGG